MADLPPRDVWIVGTAGLSRWQPLIDRIEVCATSEGKLLRLCIAGVAGEIELTQAQADHVAGLLKAPSP